MRTAVYLGMREITLTSHELELLSISLVVPAGVSDDHVDSVCDRVEAAVRAALDDVICDGISVVVER